MIQTNGTPAPVSLVEAPWTPARAEELYHVGAWGNGYFFVNEQGHVAVRPLWNGDLAIDLYDVVAQLRRQGLQFPVLLRFQDLLQARVILLNETFRKAIAEAGYGNAYQGVFPVKVNQLREVVEEILAAGQPYRYGLECGSKAELIATLPYLEHDDMLLLSNGCKDAGMMRLMLAAQGLGKNVIPILERYEEFRLLRALEGSIEGAGAFGVRVRLSTAGAGLWAETGGESSKFGLSIAELLRLVGEGETSQRPVRLRLLHFHLGSQIAHLRNVRQAVQEAARIYAHLRRRGLPITYFDIGGGLGINYEAGNPDTVGSINYTLDAYAQTVVETLREVCDEEGVPHPVLVSESGRAITAHHSVLVTEVVSTRVKDPAATPPVEAPPHPLLEELAYLVQHVTAADTDVREEELAHLYQAAQILHTQMADLLRAGKCSLEQKARAEHLYWTLCYALLERLRRLDPPSLPDDFAEIDKLLADNYLCNFSLFRSIIDHWAIGQAFPILPIHRLDEAPTRRGILVDLTCDSDGKVADFVSPFGDKHYLELHPQRDGEPYYLGIFLMGAYQDVMGDAHNLFGEVPEAHIYADAEEPGDFYLETILPGTSVEQQLSDVQYHRNDLERRMNELIQEKVRAKTVRPKEGVQLLEQYKAFFSGITYLTDDQSA